MSKNDLLGILGKLPSLDTCNPFISHSCPAKWCVCFVRKPHGLALCLRTSRKYASLDQFLSTPLPREVTSLYFRITSLDQIHYHFHRIGYPGELWWGLLVWNISDSRPFVWVSNLDGDGFGRAGKKSWTLLRGLALHLLGSEPALWRGPYILWVCSVRLCYL